MLLEFSIYPISDGSHISGKLAETLKIVHSSGLPYQLTPSGTCVEGDWDQVLPLIRRCHDRAREMSSHVVTIIQIEDEERSFAKLTENISSVEKKVGHKLHI